MKPHPLLRRAAPALLALLVASSLPGAQEARPRRVAILVFPGVELLDFAGPGEVFAAAGHAGGRAFEVYTVAASREPILSQGFVEVTPGHALADAPHPDLIVVPGGRVPLDSEPVLDWLRREAARCEVVLSVCNGAALLARAGLLEGLEVTTHQGSLRTVAVLEPGARVLANRRFVDTGHVVTTAGVSAGIDGALHLVARLVSGEEARATAGYLEYDWRPDELAELHARPAERVEPAAFALLASLAERGREATLAEHRAAEQEGGAAFVERRGEAALNREAYALLRAERLEDALELLEFVAAAWPASANARDSLSEVHERAGNLERSLALAHATLAVLHEDAGLGDDLRLRLVRAASARIERLGDHPAGQRWACEPCDLPCDAARFEAPGLCPDEVCGMQLVPVD